MLSLLEIAERVQKGPKLAERDWDLGLFRTMNELVKKYEIKLPDDGRWINTDDALADRVYAAAVEFLVTKGVYCLSTGRVVQFAEEEVRQAISEAPSEIIVGEGRDVRTIRQRQVEGRERLNICPGLHGPYDEELAPLVIKSFAEIPRSDFIEGFNVAVIEGREIHGLPMEAYAARREAGWLREGVRKAGRPGMAVVLYPISTRAAALMAPIDPVAGLRPSDGILISILPDTKMESEMLAAAIAYEDYGSFKLSGSIALAGGFCGSVEGATIGGVVNPIAAMLVYRDYMSYTAIGTITPGFLGAQAGREKRLLRVAESVVNQALNRNTNTILLCSAGGGHGPGTEATLVEGAVRSIASAVNGVNPYSPTRGPSRPNGRLTPLEAEWMVEVADAAIDAGLTRERAGELIGALEAQIEGLAVDIGRTLPECYDLVHHRPTEEYRAIYLRVKESLVRMGLPLQ